MLDKLTGSDLQQLLDGIGAPAFMIEVEQDGGFVYCGGNRQLSRYAGLRPQDLVGRGPDDLMPPPQAQKLKQHYRECVATRESVEFEEFLDLPQTAKWWRVILTPLFDEASTVVRLFGTAIDITKEKQAQQKMAYQNLLLRAQQELTPDGILVADMQDNILSWNSRFQEIWNLSEEQMLQGRAATFPRVLAQLADPDAFRQQVEHLYRTPAQSLQGFEIDLKDGRTLTMYSRSLIEEDGTYWGRVWYVRDVTRSKQRERQLGEALALQRGIFNSASQTIITTSVDGVIRSFNAAAEKLLGYEAAEVVDRATPYLFFDPEEIEPRRSDLSRRLGRTVTIGELFHGDPGRHRLQEWHCVHKDGHKIPVELTLTPLFDDGGQQQGFLWVSSDISERRAYERRLQEMARIDGLTGLWNRRHFQEVTAQVLELARREREPLSVLVLDIDHFKRINDTHGHAAGDQVLQAVASALSSCLRASDMWCRWGGEEFAIALVNTPLEGALIVAERVRAAIEALQVVYEGRSVHVTASIGASTWLATEATIEQVLHRADLALYQAKQAGRNRSCAKEAERLVSQGTARQAP